MKKMKERIFDTIFSFVMFALVNAVGGCCIILGKGYWDIEYSKLLLLFYAFVYVNSLIEVFGYRAEKGDGVVILYPSIGIPVQINVHEIISFNEILNYIYILKSKQGSYLIWGTLNYVARKKLVTLIHGDNRSLEHEEVNRQSLKTSCSDCDI
jgi:hypothetical protein